MTTSYNFISTFSVNSCVAVVITWLWDIVVVINVRIGHITFFLQSYLWIVKEVGKQGLLVHLFPHFIGENWVLNKSYARSCVDWSFFLFSWTDSYCWTSFLYCCVWVAEADAQFSKSWKMSAFAFGINVWKLSKFLV